MENKVGIRDLKQNPSKVIALVKQGQAFTVTERGVPVAKLVPIAEDPFTQLVQEGVIRLPKGNLDLSLIKPQKLPEGVDFEAIFAEMREDRF